MKLKEGDWVKLRNGDIKGPLRDRTHENDFWPWGLKCSKCEQDIYGTCWRPDGRASNYNKELPFENYDDSPYDIIEVIKRPNPLDELMRGLPHASEDPYKDGDLAHWIASPMKDVGTCEQFHDVVDRAQRVLNYWRLRDQAHNINQEKKPWPPEIFED